MGFNLGSAYGTGVAGAALGLSAGPIGAAIGGGLGMLAGGFLGGSSGSNSANTMSMEDMYNLEMYNTIKDLFFMHEQNRYNTSNMRYQTDLQRELNEQAFNYNNYFLDNAYQKSVNSMRAAGLNPLLLSGHSPSVGSASAGSSSALGIQAGSHGIDPSSMLSASANSAQAKIAKGQLALNAANTMGDIAMKRTSSALQAEQAKTEANKRENIDADTLLKGLQSVSQNITNSNLDAKQKAEIKKDLATAESTMIMAKVSDYLKEYQAYNYVHSARAQEVSAGAQSVGAKAQYITATQGNAEKAIIDMMMGAFGVDNPKDLGVALNKFVKDYNGNNSKGKLHFGSGWMN